MPPILPTATEFASLFDQIRPKLSVNQVAMLQFHFKAGRPVTATELANHVGYKDWRGVNVQYGGVGTMLREMSPVLRALEGQESYAFARFDQIPRKDESYPEWIWTFHDPAREALATLPWINE